MKKTLYFYPLTLLGLIIILANSSIKEVINSTTLTFQDLACMNQARFGFAYSSDNDNIYISNGCSKIDQQFTTEIEKYSVANNTWTVFAQSLVAKKYSTSAIVGNYLYIFGGKTDKGASNEKTEVVDLSNGNVKYTTNNPSPADICGAATWDESIYVFGGSESNPFEFANWSRYSDKLYRFDTSTSTWTELASMPESNETKGAIVNGKLYVFGGYGYNGTVSNRIDMYDIKTNVWKRLGKMPKGVSANAIAAYGTTIFIVGDYTNETYLATYEVNTGVFNVIQSNMIARRHAGAAVVNSKLYVMGGFEVNSSSSLQMASLKQ